MTIDAHQHFWKYNKVSHSWISDEMAILKQDFLPYDLSKILTANGIDGCIAVQADQSEEETKFLLDLAEKNDFIKAVVGWVDLRADNIEERLHYYHAESKLAGFRHVVQDEPDINFMLGKAFMNGISLLEQFGFTYDILIFPTQMDAALGLVKAFPNQKFVIDHIAKPYIKKGDIERWKLSMNKLAAFDNVWCKISGMVTEADWQSWKQADFTPYLDVVLKAFGTKRVMFGSDWPVCLLAAEYGEVKEIVTRAIGSASRQEQAQIMGDNAAMFYNFNQ